MRFLLIAGNIWFIPFRCEMIGSVDLNGKHSEVSGKLVDQDVDGWIILRCLSEIQDVVVWIELIWLRIGTSVRFL
jgi:hypothetical protein